MGPIGAVLPATGICWWCRGDLAMLYRDHDGQIVGIEPYPQPDGRWQVSRDGRRCRRAPPGARARYAEHVAVCPARYRGSTQGLCRGRGCRRVVTLYGERARLLCDDCAARLAAWRADPHRGAYPV